MKKILFGLLSSAFVLHINAQVMPKVTFGVKLPTFEFEEDEIIKIECISKIMLEYGFGFSSKNYQYMLDQELVSGFTYSFHYDCSSSHIKFIANSFNPKDLVSFLKKQQK